MRPPGLKGRERLGQMLIAALVAGIQMDQTARAEAPAVTIGPSGVRIRIVSSSLPEALDALARSGGFRVMYEGARPTARLFNSEIDVPTVPQALFRLLDGQNLNYGVVLDPTGTKVTSVLVLGVVPKPGGASPSAGSAKPKAPQAETSVAVENDEPAESDPEPEPEAAPSPTPSPAETRPGSSSPFGPRSPFLGPFGPRPTPSTSPPPSA